MSSQAKRLLDEALRLPPEDREALAGQLFDSLDPVDPDAESAWNAEIERRLSELDRGDVQPIPWSAARAMIFGNAEDSAGP